MPPPRELAASTSHLLKRAAWLAKDRWIEAFEAIGASPYHYGVLVLLDEEPRETQGAIADALGHDRSHLVAVLDELEERGLIERKRDPSDRRRHLVSVTPAGKAALDDYRALAARLDDELFAPLDAAQRETLHELLLALMVHHEPRYAPRERGD